MSKICYGFFDSSCEITDTEFDGGDLTVILPKSIEGFLCIGKRKHRIDCGKVTLPLSQIDNGKHTPHLITAEAELILPAFQKDDKLITLPEDEGYGHKLSLRLARICCRVNEIEKKLSELEKFVRGTTCF